MEKIDASSKRLRLLINEVLEMKSSAKGKGCYEMIVSDNGADMSEEFAKEAFDAFEREYNSTISGIEGTGLGLSIVKRIVEVMGGSIDLQIRWKEGTTFTICLNLYIAEEESYL